MVAAQLLSDFKKFIGRGNVLDLAVAVVMGAAFKSIIDSLVADIVTPLIGIFLGGINFGSLTLTIGNAHIKYGAFIQAGINFLIIAWVIFLVVYNISRLQEKLLGTKYEGPQLPATEISLLKEIRDLLKK